MILLFHIVQTDWISMGYLINALIHTEATMPQALFEVVVVTAIACIISVLLQRSSKHASNAAVKKVLGVCSGLIFVVSAAIIIEDLAGQTNIFMPIAQMVFLDKRLWSMDGFSAHPSRHALLICSSRFAFLGLWGIVWTYQRLATL